MHIKYRLVCIEIAFNIWPNCNTRSIASYLGFFQIYHFRRMFGPVLDNNLKMVDPSPPSHKEQTIRFFSIHFGWFQDEKKNYKGYIFFFLNVGKFFNFFLSELNKKIAHTFQTIVIIFQNIFSWKKNLKIVWNFF